MSYRASDCFTTSQDFKFPKKDVVLGKIVLFQHMSFIIVVQEVLHFKEDDLICKAVILSYLVVVQLSQPVVVEVLQEL
jgi:hypothetical protein